ncbi:acyl carrier protein [Aureibaculum marinum]|uniref:Acyl carrier protein n=1 Tax=Aureibaculum marinum TaxID=2487930 RepID=A0A3N4NE67_9FLAO|nr:acyl carrier protein [Aureibaculum marinum]RPD91716.1 acyl carrier protein [Aureibaculum marinum]
MSTITHKDSLLELLATRLELLEIKKEEVDTTKSLFEQGILDSLSFLEFAVEIEAKFDMELDFSELDPTEFNSIEKLSKIIENGN